MGVRPAAADFEVYRLVEAQGGDKRAAFARLASERGADADSIRRMYQRGATHPAARMQLLEYLLTHPTASNSAHQDIQSIVAASGAQLIEHRARLDGIQTAVFVSDIHFPHVNLDALRLYYILLDVIRPVYISALNDALDYAAISHHEERRTVRERGNESDVSQALRLYEIHVEQEHLIAPQAAHVAIVGNHDAWIAQGSDRGASETLTASTMRRLHSKGVQFTDTMARQNMFRVNDALVWMHGISAAASANTVASRNLQQAALVFGKRTAFDVVCGHTHRPTVTRVGLSTHYNSGCLCSLDPYYMKHKPAWGTGITVSQFDPHGAWHSTQLVEFFELDNEWRAVYNGKMYSVKKRR